MVPLWELRGPADRAVAAANVGACALGEGIFMRVGEHGSQGLLTDGGATIGPTVCPR